MTLLERIFGVETIARIREEARQAQARALELNRARLAATVAQTTVPRSAQRQASAAGVAPQAARAAAGVSNRVASVEPARAGGFTDVLPADFPTSILGAAAVATPPLLTAFASREALLAAVVYSEALAPPIALR